MATATKKWRVYHRDLGEIIIEAERFEKTGSGTYFYGPDENQVAAFGDQEVKTILPESLKITK